MLSRLVLYIMLSVHTVSRRRVGGVIPLSEWKRDVRAGVKIVGQGTAVGP